MLTSHLNTQFQLTKLALVTAGEKYLEILNLEPNHPDANHNFGLIALKMDEQAWQFSSLRTQSKQPNIKEYWVSCINTLIELKDVKNAQIALDKAKEVGHIDEVFEKLALTLDLQLKKVAKSKRLG